MKLTLTWLIVVSALSLFTFSVVGTAATTKPDYAGAAKKLPRDQPLVVINTGKHEVCSVDATQLALLQAEYETGWMAVTMNGAKVDLVTVSGAKDGDLKRMLGNVRCTLVKEKHLFYLPFDANVS